MGEENVLERCTYELPKKKRKCRMLVKSGKKFCGEHAIFDPNNDERIPCPNDPKHTVSKSELADHLANRCNSRISSEPWISENINVVQGVECEPDEEYRPSDEELTEIIKLIEEGYEKESIASAVETRILEAPLVEEHLREKADINATHVKHLKQISSIIGNLLADDLLQDNKTHSIFELGAGKAQLAYWMAKTAPNCRFLLIDRMGARNKYDNKAIRENSSLAMTRLRCSIEHLDLSKVESLKGVERIVSVCKHFCGEATDMGIRSLINAVNHGFDMSGFALAPCCHHKSMFSSYTGHDFLKKIHIQTSRHFSALRHVATWATCGMKRSEAGIPVNNPGLSADEKEQLGIKAKTILEVGRAKYLETIGYDVRVYRYVDFSLSPENLLIVGRKKSLS